MLASSEVETSKPLFDSDVDNLALPQRYETSMVVPASHEKDNVYHDTIKAVKRSLASRGSSRHKLSAIEFSVIEQTPTGDILFKTTPYRWFMLFLFCLLIVNVLMAQVGFSAFVLQIRAAYGAEKWQVLLLITSPTIFYAPITYVTTVLMADWKSHNLLKLAAIS